MTCRPTRSCARATRSRSWLRSRRGRNSSRSSTPSCRRRDGSTFDVGSAAAPLNVLVEEAGRARERRRAGAGRQPGDRGPELPPLDGHRAGRRHGRGHFRRRGRAGGRSHAGPLLVAPVAVIACLRRRGGWYAGRAAVAPRGRRRRAARRDRRARRPLRRPRSRDGAGRVATVRNASARRSRRGSRRLLPPARRPGTLDPAGQLTYRERGRSETGATPVRPRHCDGHGLSEADIFAHDATGQPGRRAKARSQETSPFAPPDIPSGEGRWRVDRVSRRRAPPVFGPEDGRFSFPASVRPRRRAARPARLGRPACRVAGCRGAPAAVVDDAGDTVAARRHAAPRRVAHPRHHRAAVRHRRRRRASSGAPSGATTPPRPPRCPTWATASTPTSKRCSPAVPIWSCSTTPPRTRRSRAACDRSASPRSRLNTDALGDVDRVGRLLGRLTGHAAAADSHGRGVRHAPSRHAAVAPRRPAAEGAAARLGAAADDDRPRQLPERAGRAGRRHATSSATSRRAPAPSASRRWRRVIPTSS